MVVLQLFIFSVDNFKIIRQQKLGKIKKAVTSATRVVVVIVVILP